MKKYIALDNNNGGANFLKIENYYYLGGYNYFTYTEEKRGYYLSVSPVERSTRSGCTMESYTAFSGIKILLLPVSRKSKKAEAEAERIAAERETELINYVCNKNGLILAEVESYV